MAPEAQDQLRFGPLGPRTVHLCVDMQRLFAEGPWTTPWLKRVLPRVRDIVDAHPAETIFTRFIPAERPEATEGAWRRYWRKWPEMTLEQLDPDMIELVPELRPFCPPAQTIDKTLYAPWEETDLDARLRARAIDTLVITGCETDVCVLATVLGAVDLGYRVVLITDALCSSTDATHDALMQLYRDRYGQQVETVKTETLLAEWR